MSDTEETKNSKLSGKRLSLNRVVEAGRVKQSFSHGRSKSVVVERKRKRLVVPQKAGVPEPEAPRAVEPAPVAAKPVAPKPQQPPGARAGGKPAHTLTERERQARLHALEEARLQEIEEKKRAEREAIERVRREEEERIAREKEQALAEARAREEASRPAPEPEPQPAKPVMPPVAPGREKPAPEKKKIVPVSRKKIHQEPKTAEKPRQEDRRRGKLTIARALDDSPRQRSMASIRRKRAKEKKKLAAGGQQEKIARNVIIPETISVQELANRMSERAVDVIKILMSQGQMLKITDMLDADTAQLIAEELGHHVSRVAESDVEESLHSVDDAPEDLLPRPPVVTIMGHVDHGKTSLLDAMRHTSVASGEAGGITQHIGAYQIKTASGQRITFLDTPGHAAFTAMRARGARVTDIVVIVVAADDGVMPQTIEAINHAKAAEVPIIVAINKMDKPAADPSRVRNELLQHGVFVESMGGDILEVEVSALKGTNLDKLEEAILLQAELLELKANPNRRAEGVVVEARLDRGRGPVATVLIQRGTLRKGDIVIAGTEWGKVRVMINDHGQQVTESVPSMPVEVLGLNGTPGAGDMFAVADSEASAREITEYRQRKQRLARTGTTVRTSLEQMMNQLGEAGKKEFPIVIKADVQGSVEAISAALEKLGNEEVTARIVHAAVGGITESDVTLAAASRAVILGFNVRANAQAREASRREHCEIRYYSVIYNLIDDVTAAMSGMLAPTLRETFLGNAEILEVFRITKVGNIAGCRVTEGMVKRGARVRLVRDNVVIHEGTLSTLKRFKDEVREVQTGQECGMSFEKYDDLKVGDVIECFEVEEVERTL